MMSCLCPGALKLTYLFSVMFWGASEIKHNTEVVINILRAFLRINQILSNVYLWVWRGCDHKNNLKSTWTWVNRSHFESICQQNINHCTIIAELVYLKYNYKISRGMTEAFLCLSASFMLQPNKTLSCIIRLCWPLVVTFHSSRLQ